LILIAGLARFAKFGSYYRYISLALRSRNAPWRKALFLDLFLHDLHLNLFKKHTPNFSTLFLNAGAHIQHHYFFNAMLGGGKKQFNPEWYISSKVDPMAEVFKLYDDFIGDFLRINDAELIVATGLSQKPYDRVKFYYRLKEHEKFLRLANINYLEVLPRMTRDFLINFDDHKNAAEAEKKIRDIRMSGTGVPIFGDVENRGDSLFVTLSYPHEISETDKILTETGEVSLQEQVTFVAIKNGMHDTKGYAFFSEGVKPYAFSDGAHIKELYNSILGYFGHASMLKKDQSSDEIST